MEHFGPRSLILLVVAAAMTTVTPAGAQMQKRTARDSASSFTKTQTSPSYQRMALTQATTPGSRQPLRVDHGAYSREIAEAAARHAVPERLIWAVIRAESGFDHRAVSPKGARGLMQLMPETAAILGVRDSFDPRENIDAGVRHLRALIERFRHNLHFAIAAYNAGEGAVVAFRGIPPYPETREYVARVLRFYGMPTEWAQEGSAVQLARQGSSIQWGQLQGSGIHQIVEPDGTIIYTNVPTNISLRRFSEVSAGR
jgi:soluble lytic murein transglycosylase-like protein